MVYATPHWGTLARISSDSERHGTRPPQCQWHATDPRRGLPVDLSAKRRTEGEVVEELAVSLASQWPMPVAIVDEDRCFVFGNDAFQRLVPEWSGRDVSEALGPLYPDLAPVVERILAGAGHATEIELIPAPDASEASALFGTFAPVIHAGRRCVGMVLFDPSIRSGSAEGTRLSRERGRALLLASGELLWSTDSTGTLIRDSPSWRSFTGQQEVEGRSWFGLVHPSDRPTARRKWDACVETRRSFGAEVRLQHASGGYRRMLTRAVPVIIDAQLMEWYCFALELGSAPPTDAATGRPTVEEQRQVQALRRELAAALASARTSKEAVHIAIDRGPRLLGADGALVLLERGVNGLRVVGQQGVPPEAGARWKVVPAGADSPALESMRAGRWVRRSVTAANGAGAVITDSFPLGDDDQVFGAMTFVWPSEESSRPAAAAHTAAVTGEVLSRILQSEKDQAVAEDLQRLMLPRSLPRIDGAELAAVSIPGSSDAQVGGDWFEAVSLPDGQVLLVVGDVMGRGLRAAKTMTELRFALRAFTVVTSEPHAVLANLAKHLELFGREDDLITVLAVLVEPRTGSIRWSSAGHIPPILIHHGGNGEYLLDGQGSPLGVGDEWPQAKARLEDGDQVVLVSDGLVETRTRSLDEGMDRLLRAVAGSGARSAAVLAPSG